MFPSHRVFWCPKQGNRAEEYEDASATRPEAGRFAVADGATESAFSALWAGLLVQHFVDAPDAAVRSCGPWLLPAQREWLAYFDGRDLPYAAEAHFQRGAFATFLGLLLSAQSENTYGWKALAIGDSCIFQTRNASLLRAFPIERSDGFSNCPRLVGSRMAPEEVERKRSQVTEDQGCARDRLWLMTDALSQWFLHEHEAGKKPWMELEWLFEPVTTNEHFGVWIDSLRKARQIRNDDVTLLVIHLE